MNINDLLEEMERYGATEHQTAEIRQHIDALKAELDALRAALDMVRRQRAELAEAFRDANKGYVYELNRAEALRAKIDGAPKGYVCEGFNDSENTEINMYDGHQMGNYLEGKRVAIVELK